MKIYLIVNPFSETASHGIHNYNQNLMLFLEQENIDYDIFSNNNNLSKEEFRVAVKEYVEKNYGYDEVLIEAPEVKASTLLLSAGYKVHVRLHTPGAIAQKYDGAKVNEELFREELKAIELATFVSAPSYGIVNELSDYLTRDDFSVYKNPFNLKTGEANVNKEFDIVFMARFQKLKGIEFLNPILEQLPKEMNVLLFGNNSHKFKLSKKIKCKVLVKDHIAGSERFVLIKESKNLLQLSKFENCSMVILEGLACNTVVHAWDVGGNKEIADNSVLKISPVGDVQYLVNQLLDSNNLNTNKINFDRNLRDIHEDFSNGIYNLIMNHPNKNYKPFLGDNKQDLINYREDWLTKAIEKKVFSHSHLYNNFGKRVFGFSMSNEHIEEFWMPIIDKMGSDYKFVCSRPLGFMYKFNNPYYVNPEKYSQYDWMRYPNFLIDDIREFKPHKIFFHNGSHPMYKEILERVKKAFPDIPIVYSELGWFPQKDNVYFDIKGVNGLSHISEQNFEEFCGQRKTDSEPKKLSGHNVIITQLENDTNLIINSNRFKKMEKFVEYCLSELPENEKVIVKLHPLENSPERFDKFNSENVVVVLEGELTNILKNSKAVIGINSTVLLESLQYDTNIYYFGDGVISNKEVAIDCTNTDIHLKDVLTDFEFSSREDKQLVVEGFKNRQIYLPSLTEYTIAECLELEAFKPLTHSLAKYTNTEEFDIANAQRKPKTKNPQGLKGDDQREIKADIAEIKTIISQIPAKITSSMPKAKVEQKLSEHSMKKLRKLRRDPYSFFQDSNKKGSKLVAIFFKKRN